MLTFNRKYFLLTLLVLLIEILIAVYVHDGFVRPYLGDVLVVILIYFFVRAFFMFKPKGAAALVFIFACFIEYLQHVKVVDRFGWENSRIAQTILGTTAEWSDVLAYAVGIIGVLMAENSLGKRSFKRPKIKRKKRRRFKRR